MNNDITTYTPDELTNLLTQWKQPKFRVKQLLNWLYVQGVESYDQMTNLPGALRTKLMEEAPLHFPTIESKRISDDGSRKYLLSLSDGCQVETVGIPSTKTDANGDPRRLTVCISSQVGCPMGCSFCATGDEGFTRNLFVGEMVQQVLCVQKDFGRRVSNVVVMGQGEPFLNYDNTLAALRLLNSPDGLAIGARHITVSSCGIMQGIRAFGREPEQFTFALSLHSAIQEIRDHLMPQCKNTSLKQLKEVLRSYQSDSGRRVTLEYLLIQGINDSDESLKALISFCRGIQVHINLLPINRIEGSPYQPVPKETLQYWIVQLTKAGIETSKRDSRGSDIDGACGQLKNQLD